MSLQERTEVLICGAGAAGLTLAIELARRGVAFRLIEKRDTPFPGSRGKGIQPRTQEIFEDLGVLDRMFAAGGRYPVQRIYRDDGSHVDREMGERAAATPAEPYREPLMVPQFITERILRDRLRELGHQVEFGRELTGFEQDGEGIFARVAPGDERVHVRYMVGADGGRSFVRKSLGIEFAGKTLGVHALVADVELDGLSADVWHQFNDGDMARMLAICPLAGTRFFQIQAPIAPEAQPDLSAEGLTGLIAERTGRTDIVVRSVAWASDYQMNARLAARYREGCVFLVGDAAHVHPPTGGQGLNTSVQDAYNLGWKLAAVLRGADERVLDSYEMERRPVAEDVLGLSSRLLDGQKHGATRRGREVQQLDIGYPDSPLVLNGCGYKGALRAGYRAPDAVVRGAAGQSARLFALFKGTHWTLLAQGAQVQLERSGIRVHQMGEGGEFADVWGHVREAYALEQGDAVLVRPDGYIAAIVDAATCAGLDDWLTGMGIPRSPA